MQEDNENFPPPLEIEQLPPAEEQFVDHPEQEK
jgi:hypothetical protein